MSRIYTSSLLLAAALVIAGCGGSNTDSVPHPGQPSVASLKGQYAFQMQVYTNYGGGTLESTPAANGHFGKVVAARSGFQLPRREAALAGLKARAGVVAQRKAAMAGHGGSKGASAPKPEQGDQYNQTIVWGAAIGSLTFDGDGHITAGEIDFNEPLAGTYSADTVTSGSYAVGSDQTGTLTVNTASSDVYTYDFTLQGAGTATGSVSTGAQMVEAFDDGAGDVEIGTGQLVQQVSGATLNGNYVFGVRGETCYGCTQTATGDLFAAGVLAADGNGNFASTGQADISTGFQTDNQVGVTGTYGSADGNGRLTANLTTTGYANGALPAGYVIYVANSSTAFILSTDLSPANQSAAWLYGQMGLQSGSFSNSSLAGNYVVAETTEDLANETIAPDTYSDASIALLSATGGTLDGTGDVNDAGAIASSVPFNYGTYTVASNGRVTLNGTTPSGAPAPVFWLQNAGTGYGVDQLGGNSSLQEPGLLYLYQQSAASSAFSAASLSGTYAVGNLPAAISNVGEDVNGNLVGPGLVNGSITADGNGNVSGSNGESSYIVQGPFTGSFSGTYTVGANGRGVITGSSSSVLGTEIFYVTSGGMAVGMDVTSGDTSPSLQVFQQ